MIVLFIKLWNLLLLYFAYYKIKYPRLLVVIRGLKSIFFILMLVKRIVFFSLLPWYLTFVIYNVTKHRFVIEINLTYAFKIHVISFLILCYFLFRFIVLLALNQAIYNNVFLTLIANLFFITLFSKIVTSFLFAPYASLFLNNSFIHLL